MQYFWSFLGHGGFKLLIIAFFVIGNLMKSRAKTAKKREAEVRGSTAISDFSAPDESPATTNFPVPTAKPAPFPTASPRKSANSDVASPWSSNQNPFE